MSNDIDFNNVRIIKKLGAGFFGTTYLAEYDGVNYALKMQHIFPTDKVKNYKAILWRELSLYEYINNLKPEWQIFFTKLYGYEIINNCDFEQIRPYKLNKKDKFDRKILRLDKSKWCSKLLIEYKGNKTLGKYLDNNNLTINQAYSIILQMCNIIMILHVGGYAHNDLHSGNIMINSTKKKTFNFLHKKIPFCGLHISAIDYGQATHKKFIQKKKDGDKKKKDGKKKIDRKDYLFDTLYHEIMRIILNAHKNVWNICCPRKKKRPPYYYFGIGLKTLMKKHPDFYTAAKNKYMKVFPKSKKMMSKFEKNIHKTPFHKIIRNKEDSYYFMKVIDRIVDEFSIVHPKLYIEYFRLCSYKKCNLPIQYVIGIMMTKNASELLHYLVDNKPR